MCCSRCHLSICLAICLFPTVSFLRSPLHKHEFFYRWCLLNKHRSSDTQPFCGLSSILCLTRQVGDIHSPLRSESRAEETVHRGLGTIRWHASRQKKMTMKITCGVTMNNYVQKMSEPCQNWFACLCLSGVMRWVYHQRYFVYKGDYFCFYC